MDANATDSAEALRAWVQNHVGRGRQFSSAREWAVRAGYNPAHVSTIETTGRATCETLIRLARAAGEQPLSVLVLAGWLTAAEIGEGQVALDEEEAKLLRMYRETRPDLRRVIQATLRGAWSTSRGASSE